MDGGERVIVADDPPPPGLAVTPAQLASPKIPGISKMSDEILRIRIRGSAIMPLDIELDRPGFRSLFSIHKFWIRPWGKHYWTGVHSWYRRGHLYPRNCLAKGNFLYAILEITSSHLLMLGYCCRCLIRIRALYFA